MSTKTLNFFSSLIDAVLPFYIFVFKFFYYLIARLNLEINEQSEKFWYGINDKASAGEYTKELGENGGV